MIPGRGIRANISTRSVIVLGGLLAVALSAILYSQNVILLPLCLDLSSTVGMSNLMGFNGTGVYNSSVTPTNLPWNTYNYCNAPHVTAQHYEAPKGAELVYLNLMMRHHKVTRRCSSHLYRISQLC